MAQAANLSIKRLLIEEANSTVIAVTAAACFITVFCLVASFTLIGQLSYQNRVIGKKKQAYHQLQADIQNVSQLQVAYSGFSGAKQNLLGGLSDGIGPQDGDNAKLVLDALPSKYDFPALTTSLEKMLTAENVQIQSITGTDDEVAQSAGDSSAPQVVPMPFELTVGGGYDNIKAVINDFQNSIRPIQAQTLDLAASGQGQLTMTLDAQSYYKPEKTLTIRKETVQ